MMWMEFVPLVLAGLAVGVLPGLGIAYKRLRRDLSTYRLAADMEADEVDHLSKVLADTREELAYRSGDLADAVAGRCLVRVVCPSPQLLDHLSGLATPVSDGEGGWGVVPRPPPPSGWVVLKEGEKITAPYFFIDDYSYRGWGQGGGCWAGYEVPRNGGVRFAVPGVLAS
jgi:hypothetical protein